MASWRLQGSVTGPSTPVAWGGSFVGGLVFFVTGEAWLTDFLFWCCPSGQSTAPVNCALWQVPVSGSPVVVPGSVIPVSGTLVPNQWNQIHLSQPLLLSLGGSSGWSPATNNLGCAQYVAAVGFSGNFPDLNNFWGPGQVSATGSLTSGPLTGYSTQAGGMPAPYQSWPQGCFSTTGSDASANCPTVSSASDNFMVDVMVSDTQPFGSAQVYRAWPSFPIMATTPNNDTTSTVSSTEMHLTEACTLDSVWMFSPAGAGDLPSRVGVWDCSTQQLVPGTDNPSPAWSGAAGSGWVSVSYTGITLPAGSYRPSMYHTSGLHYYQDIAGQFNTAGSGKGTARGPGYAGIRYGPLFVPDVSAASSCIYDDASGTHPGQTQYQTGGGFIYPNTFEATGDWGETRGVDMAIRRLATSLGPHTVLTDTHVSWPPGTPAQYVRRGTVVYLDPASPVGVAYGGPTNLAVLGQVGDDADHVELGN